jgi:ferredoxin--NADP+ reductase
VLNAAKALPAEKPKAFFEQKVVEVRHWASTLFSFRLERPESFRFRSGEFVMVGLETETKPLLRAYSLASPFWDETLEFYSIIAADGALTPRLKNIQVGDTVLLGKKPTGTLVLDALLPGKTLYMLSTGTGVAPFASLIRDPETYERYERVVLTHTCRTHAELEYGHDVVKRTLEDELIGEEARAKLTYFTSVTQEEGQHVGRITHMIEDGRLFDAIGEPRFNPEHDRIMICGSEYMLRDLKGISEAHGFVEGSNAIPGQFVIEKAFVG